MRTWFRRLLASFALCVCVLLVFPYALDIRSSDAQNSGAPAMIPRLPRISVPRLNPTAPKFEIAAREAVAELLGSGDGSIVGWRYGTGLWGGHIKPNWWQSALAMLTLIRYAERTHSVATVIQKTLLRIYRRNVYKPHSAARQYFANEFNDDTGWWGIAWLEASRYELRIRHDPADARRFLAVAEWDARYINGWPRPCGGIGWAINRPPDTVSSAEFITLTAALTTYRDTPGIFYDPAKASTWLGEATGALAWLENDRLIDMRRGTVVNGLTAACQRTGAPLTYTEGEVAEALVQLGTALHDPSYYADAFRFLRFTLTPSSGLISRGVLQERCEPFPGQCAHLGFHLDLPAFKGVFVNAVSDWSTATRSDVFRPFLQAQAVAVLNNAVRGAHNEPERCESPRTCQFAFSWTGRAQPAALGVTLGGQESAIDALTAVLARRR